MKDIHKFGAEFLGTFAFVFVGVSATCNNIGPVGVALAHGLTIAVMVSALGHISGGHFNPAVTVGALVTGNIGVREAISYIFAQLLGAYIGALTVKSSFSFLAYMPVNLGVPMLSTGTMVSTGIFIEFILTFFLLLVVFGTTMDSRGPQMGGLFVGLTVTLAMLAGGPITGAAMNPARAFGPALALGVWHHHFVYWIGPLLGGVIGALVYRRWIGQEGN